MTQVFISRAELLPGGETTGDHKKWQKEETELVERDKSNVDRRVGGLFRGSFKSPLRAIRDDEDGVERCPRCMWETEDGLCFRCHPAFYDDGMMADDFSDLDERLSASTYDESDEGMELEIDMEDRDRDIDPDLWTQDDSDISLDGDGRPIHTVRELLEGGWDVERRGARNIGAPVRAAAVPRMGEALDWEHGVQRWHSDAPTSGDEEDEAGQDEEAGSLDDFVVDDDAIGVARSQGSPGSEPSTISHDERRVRELNSEGSHRFSRESTAQPSDEEDSDEGGGVSNGRRRIRTGRSRHHRRVVSQHVLGEGPILNTSDNESHSDGATDTLLQAGWSQLDQDEHEVDDRSSSILSGRPSVSHSLDLSRGATASQARHAGSASRDAHRHRSHNSGLHRGQVHHPNADSIRRITTSGASRTRRRREHSVASTGINTTDVSSFLSDEDPGSDHDVSCEEQFSPLASSPNLSAATSRASSSDPSVTEIHHWQYHHPNDSESSGYETPSGHLPQFGHQASSETATATVGRSSSVVAPTAASGPPRVHMDPNSPIYINSSPVKSEATPPSVDRTSASQQSESPISNPNIYRQRQISPRAASSITHRHPQSRPRNQTPATILEAFNARFELENRLSRPTIRGGGGGSSRRSPYARQSTQSPGERGREQAAAEKAAAKAARRRAKDLRRQQRNPFLSAQSRLSRASRLLNEAADRYSDMQGQPGPSTRVEYRNAHGAQAQWDDEVVGDGEDEMW